MKLDDLWLRWLSIGAANRPGISSLIFGSGTLEEVEDNIQALDFELSEEQHQRLTDVGSIPHQQPYTMFTQNQVELLYLMKEVKDKPEGFYKR